MDEMEKLSERITNVVNMDDKPVMPSSTSSLSTEDVMEGGFVHILNATDTSENNDKR